MLTTIYDPQQVINPPGQRDAALRGADQPDHGDDQDNNSHRQDEVENRVYPRQLPLKPRYIWFPF